MASKSSARLSDRSQPSALARVMTAVILCGSLSLVASCDSAAAPTGITTPPPKPRVPIVDIKPNGSGGLVIELDPTRNSDLQSNTKWLAKHPTSGAESGFTVRYAPGGPANGKFFPLKMSTAVPDYAFERKFTVPGLALGNLDWIQIESTVYFSYPPSQVLNTKDRLRIQPK